MITNNIVFNKEKKRVEWLARLLNYWKMNRFNYQEINPWEVYEIDFGENVNAEFSGRHYGVAIKYSSKDNPLITVIPLKSNHKPINLSSDVFIGRIKNISTMTNTVAVINQIRSVDKLRIFNINSINGISDTGKIKLTNEQVEIIKKGIKNILL